MAFLQDASGGDLRRRSTAEHRPAGTEPEPDSGLGPHASFIYRDRLADTRNGTTFGLTGQWGDRVSGSIADPNIGLRGGQRVRVGESVKELVTAPDLGFFFENAVAA